MKKIISILIIVANISHAGMLGDTQEEKAIAMKRLSLAMSLKRNPLITKIRSENKYYKKVLNKHHINYKLIIEQGIRGGKIKRIRNPLLISEEDEIIVLEKINKELKRLLEVNYIKYEKQNRNYKTSLEKFKETFNKTIGVKLYKENTYKEEKPKILKNNKERQLKKENLKKEMEKAISEVR